MPMCIAFRHNAIILALALAAGLLPFTSLGLTVENIEQIKIYAPPTTATLVQKIDASAWSPSSPDPAGIVYLDHLGTLLVSDSEVNEMDMFTGYNLFHVGLDGKLISTTTTIDSDGNGISDEPTGIAYNPSNQYDRPSLFMSDDTGPRTVYELDSGPDKVFNTGDEIVSSYKLSELFNTPDFLGYDPEGLTYDVTRDALHIVDGAGDKIYSVEAVNGIFGDGDDQMTSFDTTALGVVDPEGIAYDPIFDLLYIIGRKSDNTVQQVDPTTGELVGTIDISGANVKSGAGLAFAPSSDPNDDPSVMNLYVADRGVDNNTDPNENDGMVYELTFPRSTGFETSDWPIATFSTRLHPSRTAQRPRIEPLSSGAREKAPIWW